ncbi:MAG TPA: hypothetical protein PLU73_00920 [Bacteroidia bacterium]|nr:hypothetical protein [Bacteroidia bacterium]
MTNNFNYDVAFSFTADKEYIAEKLNSLLKNRIKCFIYFERQEELAGSDGEKKFNSIFQFEARIVVIILSKDWGQTKWTKIEETAIRNRGYDEGYDFAIVIPTDSNVKVPNWLPKNRIWINIDRWGMESAAASIEARVIEADGKVNEETTAQKAKRLNDQLNKINYNRAIINSENGVKKFNDEVEIINTYAHLKVNEFQKVVPEWNMEIFRHQDNGVIIRSYNHCLIHSPIPYASNSADRAKIKFQIWDGVFDIQLRKTDEIYEYSIIKNDSFTFFIDHFDEVCWKDGKGNLHYTQKLFDYYFDCLISNVSAAKNMNK